MSFKKIFYIIFLFLICLCHKAEAQNQQYNLVNNPSFEDTVNCPTGFSQINFAKGWVNVLPINCSSSDYFNACSNNSSTGVPNNLDGYQIAKNGVAYAGEYLYSLWWYNQREYIQTYFKQLLEINHNYYVSFYVSKSDVYIYAVNGIGAYISDNAITKNDCYYFDTVPQISNPKSRMLIDTVGWTKIDGFYTAHGGEKYITIGNFAPDSLTDTLKQFTLKPNWKAAYYLIDDVSIIDIAANAGKDTLICGALTDSIQLGTHNLEICKYTWSPAAGLSDTNIANPKAKPAVSTTYYLTVSDTSGTFASVDTVIIKIIDFQFSASSSKNNNICAGESITLTASGGVSYSWGGELGTGSSVVISPYVNTTYTVTGTDSNGCTATADTEVEVKDCSIYIKIYPNPAAGNFIIEFYNMSFENTELEMFDILGRIVKPAEIEMLGNKAKVHTENLASGMYVFKLFKDDELLKCDKIAVIKN